MTLPESPLPRDPDYWEALARRIEDDAAAPLASYAAGREGWLGVLGRSAAWWVAAAVAATLILWLSLPMHESSPALLWMERSLVPDETAGALIGGPAPPSVDRLMAQFPPAFEVHER